MALLIIGFLALIANSTDAAEINNAMAVTVLKANLLEQSVLTKSVDGKQQIFRLTSQTPVTSLAQAGMNRSLSGGVGYQFIVYYVSRQGEKIATAFHYIGREAWNEIKGTLMKVDTKNRTLVLRSDDGKEDLFVAGEHCAIQNASGARPFIRWVSEKDLGAAGILRYTIIQNSKVAHLVEFLP